MDITTILGIIFALGLMAFGLKMLLKKPTATVASLDSELQINPETNLPIIPRHVRDQLQSTLQVEPEASAVQTQVEEVEQSENVTESAQPQHEPQPETVTEEIKLEKAPETPEAEKVVKAEVIHINKEIEKAQATEFNEESDILEAYLHEQKRIDEESALFKAEKIISFNLWPQNRRLSGDKTFKMLLKYGLRFGALSCFHRYSEDGSQLLFSVLQLTEDGEAEGFDLESLSIQEVKGLAFFLALPHHDEQNAFDVMMSISNLIAREIDGAIFDQNNQELTPQLREAWRHEVINYRSHQYA